MPLTWLALGRPGFLLGFTATVAWSAHMALTGRSVFRLLTKGLASCFFEIETFGTL
jgi:hypothetical protein